MNDDHRLLHIGEVDGIPVGVVLNDFFHTPTNGIPEGISNAGCFALAKLSISIGGQVGKGHVVWNAWRRSFPVDESNLANRSDFEGVEFDDDMDFRLFEFGYAANFSKTVFRKRAYFDHAKFGTSTDFSFSYWKADASFAWTYWETGIQFNYSYWCEHVNFLGAQAVSTKFHSCRWIKSVCFDGAGWADGVIFAGSSFRNISISGEEWHYLTTRFYQHPKLLDDLQNYAKKIGSDPTTFEGIIFSGSEFQGAVNFSNRKFKKTTLFNEFEKYNPFSDVRRDVAGMPIKEQSGNFQIFDEPDRRHLVIFRAPPNFHGCELHQDTSFEGAEFPKPTGSEEAARAYRTLKLAFSKQQAIREEQRFFKLEMEEETLRETGLKRQLFVAYKYFSDYGFSITRPFTLIIVFPALYISLFNAFLIEYQIYKCYDFFNQAPISIFWNWLTWSFLSIFTVPGVDLGKEIRPLLFGSGTFISFIALLIEIFQKALSLAGFFLIGLALRNLFKLK